MPSSRSPPRRDLASGPGNCEPRFFGRPGIPRLSCKPHVTILADTEYLVGVALPPVELGEDLDLVKARVARALDPGADARQVDHAVAHHAAVVEQVARRHQPVADMVGEDALLPR